MINVHFRALSLSVLILSSSQTYSQDSDFTEQLQLTGLPLVSIQTVDNELPTYEVSPKPEGCRGYGIRNATKVPGRMRITNGSELIYDSGDYEENESGMTIKIRGNTSARMPKKPYKIKLQKKVDLLMRDQETCADKNWLLICDEPFRAVIGLAVNKIVGLQWTPAFEYVNVMINGEYAGNYLLIESVKRNKDCRLNVSKSGFIFEFDPYWWNEPIYVKSPTNLMDSMNYTFKYPDEEDITDEELEYFRDVISRFEQSLSEENYPDYIDTQSFAAWILGHDILGTADGAGSNFFLTKYDNTDDSKLEMANMWDFDSILQKLDTWSEPHNSFCFPQLFSNNGHFTRTYKKLWDQLSPTFLEQLNQAIDSFARPKLVEALDASTLLNNARWNDDCWTFQAYMDVYKGRLMRRVQWLNEQVADLRADIPSTTTTTSSNVIFNLQGLKVVHPQKGIYIRNGRKYVVTEN